MRFCGELGCEIDKLIGKFDDMRRIATLEGCLNPWDCVTPYRFRSAQMGKMESYEAPVGAIRHHYRVAGTVRVDVQVLPIDYLAIYSQRCNRFS